MKFNVLFIFFITLGLSVTAQQQIQTEDKDNLYWQPHVEIDYSHFQSDSDEDCKRYYEKVGLNMSANIQLRGIVDIPKSHQSRKIKKRKGNDKLYLSPVFCKDCSCILSKDSVELVVYQLFFDVAEMCARGVRKELSELQQQMNINNVNTMFYTTIKNKWDERMRGTWASIYQDVLIQKKDSAYIEWKTLIDEMLVINEEFATQPHEIERLIRDKPTEKGYIEAKSIIGDLESREEK